MSPFFNKADYFARVQKTGEAALLGIGLIFAISVSLTDIFSAILLGAFILGAQFKTTYEHLKNNPIFLTAALLFLVLAIGLAYTPAPLNEAFRFLSKYRDLIFLSILACFIKTDRQREWMLAAFSVGMGIIILLGFLDWLGWFGSVIGQEKMQQFIVRSYSNSFTLFFAFLALHKSCAALNRTARILWLAAAAAALFHVYVIASSRTAYILGLFMIALWAYQRFKIRGLLAGAALGLVLVACVWQFSAVFHTRISEALQNGREYFNRHPTHNVQPTQLRIGWYTHSFKIFLQRPLQGHGTGSLLTEYKRNFAQETEYITPNAHDAYLNLGVQVGLVGIALYVTLLMLQWRLARYLPGTYRYLAQGLVILQGIGSLANSYLLDADTGVFYAYFTVLLFSGLKRSADQRKNA